MRVASAGLLCWAVVYSLCSTQESEVVLVWVCVCVCVCVSVIVQMFLLVFGKHASDLAWVECKKAKRIHHTYTVASTRRFRVFNGITISDRGQHSTLVSFVNIQSQVLQHDLA